MTAKIPPQALANAVVLPCPECPHAAEPVGDDRYRCVGDEEHEFRAGICAACGAFATIHLGLTICIDVANCGQIVEA